MRTGVATDPLVVLHANPVLLKKGVSTTQQQLGHHKKKAGQAIDSPSWHNHLYRGNAIRA